MTDDAGAVTSAQSARGCGVCGRPWHRLGKVLRGMHAPPGERWFTPTCEHGADSPVAGPDIDAATGATPPASRKPKAARPRQRARRGR